MVNLLITIRNNNNQIKTTRSSLKCKNRSLAKRSLLLLKKMNQFNSSSSLLQKNNCKSSSNYNARDRVRKSIRGGRDIREVRFSRSHTTTTTSGAESTSTFNERAQSFGVVPVVHQLPGLNHDECPKTPFNSTSYLIDLIQQRDMHSLDVVGCGGDKSTHAADEAYNVFGSMFGLISQHSCAV
ncbi:hypothetical protein SAMD00019534_030490, partial [Acytostelium subglobosum LB1]|uniref:hypothetical protein n=1 Tax=Acytostelium subglobosum LB1 TaxID=1410327 RepID=UPI000644FA77